MGCLVYRLGLVIVEQWTPSKHRTSRYCYSMRFRTQIEHTWHVLTSDFTMDPYWMTLFLWGELLWHQIGKSPEHPLVAFIFGTDHQRWVNEEGFSPKCQTLCSRLRGSAPRFIYSWVKVSPSSSCQLLGKVSRSKIALFWLELTYIFVSWFVLVNFPLATSH